MALMLKSFFSKPFTVFTSIIAECSVFMQIGTRGTLKTSPFAGKREREAGKPIIFKQCHNIQKAQSSKKGKLIGNRTLFFVVFVLFLATNTVRERTTHRHTDPSMFTPRFLRYFICLTQHLRAG